MKQDNGVPTRPVPPACHHCSAATTRAHLHRAVRLEGPVGQKSMKPSCYACGRHAVRVGERPVFTLVAPWLTPHVLHFMVAPASGGAEDAPNMRAV